MSELTPTEVRVLTIYREEWIRARDTPDADAVAPRAIRATAERTGLSFERVRDLAWEHKHRLRLGPKASVEDRTVLA